MMDIAIIGLRWLQYLAASALIGVPLFAIIVLKSKNSNQIKFITTICGLVLFIASLSALVAQTALMAGSWSAALSFASLGYVVSMTSLGKALALRAVFALLAIALPAFKRTRSSLWLPVVAGIAICASFAWTGHGNATERSGHYLHLGMNVLHSVAAGVWIGALLSILLIFARPHTYPAQTVYQSLHGFSGLGTLAVITLTLSGLLNSWFLVGMQNVTQMASTLYGQLLIAKLVLFVLMCCLAAANRYVLTPRLKAAMDETAALDTVLARLRRSVTLEMVAGVVLLGLVAIIGISAPPVSQF